jgi:hypothetical protein
LTPNHRISKAVKSGTCKGLKWEVGESDKFILYLPVTPETGEAITYFSGLFGPAATYFKVDRKAPVAFQWKLSKRDYRGIWTSATVKEIS